MMFPHRYESPDEVVAAAEPRLRALIAKKGIAHPDVLREFESYAAQERILRGGQPVLSAEIRRRLGVA